MAFKLRVRCHGIMACVESVAGDHVALLLPKASRGLITDQVAYVRFPVGSLSDESPRKPEPGPEKAPRHVILRGERLTIDIGDNSSQPLRINKDRDKRKSATPTKTDATSLAWLPNLVKLARNSSDAQTRKEDQHGALKEAYFKDPYAVRPGLLARVDFTQGYLRTSGADAVQVTFAPRVATGMGGTRQSVASSNRMRRPIAREVVLELDIAGNSFKLKSQRFDGTSNGENDLVFAPDGDLEIVIGNESASDVDRPVTAIRPLDVVAGQCMAEFELYFAMCEAPPARPLLPHLAARPGEGTCCSLCNPKPTDLVKHVNDLEGTIDEGVARTPWTALTFMATDNSLLQAAEADLEELQKADPFQVGVVVQIDRPNRNAERLVLSKGGFISATRKPLGDINFGASEELTKFLEAGKAAAPADRYAVFFPTHGSGLLDFTIEGRVKTVTAAAAPSPTTAETIVADHKIKGTGIGLGPGSGPLVDFGLGVANGPGNELTFLDNEELAAGLSAALEADERFAIIGFDACVMGLIEMAYQVHESGEFFVASQDDVRADGWSYDRILEAFAATPDPKAAAIAIVETYREDTKDDELATLSAIDLRKVPAVAIALDRLGSLLYSGDPDDVLSGHIEALALARDEARAFSNFHYIDLHGFVNAMKTYLSKSMERDRRLPEILDAADAVLRSIDDAVVETSKRDRGKSGAHGLSVYVPNSKVAPEYNKLKMSMNETTKRWRNFVVAYADAR